MSSGVWSFCQVNNGIVGLIPNETIMIVMMQISAQYITAGALCGIAIGIDQSVTPAQYHHFQNPAANFTISDTIIIVHTATLASHNYYGMIYTSTGGANMQSGYPCHTTIVALHR
jgi:type III secretory pathway component EscS